MNRLMKSGSSAFNANFISGARPIPKAATATCGVGLLTRAIYGAPGVVLLAIGAHVQPESTGRQWQALPWIWGARPFLKGFATSCVADGFDQVRVAENGFPSQANQGNSDPWAFPLSPIASCKARSSIFWNRSSRRAFGISRTGFDPDAVVMALWST